MIQLIKGIPFFKQKKEIKEADYKELVQGFTLQKLKKGSIVFNYGDDGDQFYIILKGAVTVQVRNQTLKNWKQQRLIYQRLLKWKVELDKRYAALSSKSKNASPPHAQQQMNFDPKELMDVQVEKDADSEEGKNDLGDLFQTELHEQLEEVN